MTKKYLVGNWKMHKTLQEAAQFAERFVPQWEALTAPGPTVWIAPAFVHLPLLHQALERLPCVGVAAQNCHYQAAGAHTGEVSAAMLASAGASAVLVGHSERRLYCGDTDAWIAQKVKRILEAGMQPLLCCGERWEERRNGSYQAVLKSQLLQGLAAATPATLSQVVVAYEPVWAIGTGQVAGLEVIAEAHTFIRRVLEEAYGRAGRSVPILYGGSCTAQNAAEVFACPEVAGGLIGGASLDVDHFVQLIHLLRAQTDADHACDA